MSAYLLLSPSDVEDVLVPHAELVKAQRPGPVQVTEAAGILRSLPAVRTWPARSGSRYRRSKWDAFDVPAPKPGEPCAVHLGSGGGATVPAGAISASPAEMRPGASRELAQKASPVVTFGSRPDQLA